MAENLLRGFLPAEFVHHLPFDAGYRVLEVGNDFDTPEILAAALTRPRYALVFGGYAVVSMVIGTVVLYRRDSN